MRVPPAKLHEKPAEANKSGTEGEQKAGFFAPVLPKIRAADHPGYIGGNLDEVTRHSLGSRQFSALLQSSKYVVGIAVPLAAVSGGAAAAHLQPRCFKLRHRCHQR